MGEQQIIESKLDETRRRLLDLSRANRLLNHRTKGQRTLLLFDERPQQVFDCLVEDGQTMQFSPREDAPPEIAATLPTEENAGDPVGQASSLSLGDRLEGGPTAGDRRQGGPTAGDRLEAVPTAADLPLAPIAKNGAAAGRHADRLLQTLLSGEKLQTRLVRLAREANSAMEEQGYNILYLTLGMVQWREAGAGSLVCRAPLIFVPVELARKNVQSRYSLSLFDDDILTNPCLLELCQRQFGFQLPPWDPEGEVSLDDYFQSVRKQIEGLDGWQFLPEVHLGLFSFSKLLMYRDLDLKNWPENKPLARHPLIQQLTGVASDGGLPKGEFPDPRTLDDTVRPEDCFQVVDADSSQQAAILAAKRGLSMVVEGPPGTGKSQTITNVIAECLAAGKSVLFVAEKSAALEVVKRRLENVGLGDFILEMHSRKSSKRVVLQELQRVLEKNVPPPQARQVQAQELEATRKRLNEYHRELHTPVSALAITPFEAMARAIALSGEPEAACALADVLAWSAQQLAEADQDLQTLDRRLARVGDPAQHPWRGAGIVSLGLEDRQRIQGGARALGESIRELLAQAAAMAQLLGAPGAASVEAIEKLAGFAEEILAAPTQLPPASVLDGRWDSVGPALGQWLRAGAEREQRKATWSAWMKPEAEQVDWREVLRRRDGHKSSILRLLLPSWYRDSKQLKTYRLGDGVPSIAEELLVLQALVRSGELRQQVEAGAAQHAGVFGELWRGPDSDWNQLRQFAESAVAIRQLLIKKEVDAAAVQRALSPDGRRELAAGATALDTALAQATAAWGQWLATISSDEQQWLGEPWKQSKLAAIAERLAPLPGQLDLLPDWMDLQSSLRAGRGGPWAPFLIWALSKEGEAGRGRLATTFRRHFYRLWLDRAFAQNPALQAFRGEDHQALVQRFRELDLQWIEATRQRLQLRIAASRPENHQAASRYSKLGILQAEIRKKTRHMPLRKLLASVGEVVGAIKPCFMMSPISVAQYLAPGGLEFDVVVFDEASQVEPADAYGAIARGQQVLLVGDEKQLPPTSFFAKVDSEADEPADGDGDLQVGDLESILSLGIVRLPNRCTLRWHYRSRHASLIDFSNQKFYDGNLRVFPSPHTDCSEMGRTFRYVEGGVYMRGSSRTNPVEAAAVAQAVIEHALKTPQFSLGVGTLNLPQQQAIADEVERLRRESKDPRLEEFFTAHPEEPFFVKNLENIQGDERDVILLSVANAKDPAGKFYASFGPLNSEGGWRRLNVLITRARRRCVVFSSIRADEINLGGTQARGVVALKEYLYAAEHGTLAEAVVSTVGHDSDFEAAVGQALRERGWDVHAQVGCAGFAIDLAVVDPANPGRYLLGIECDGATYHSSPTARDRDRLRQAVLEGLGWNIHRVWSTDWFHRAERTLAALIKKLEELKQAAGKTVVAAPQRAELKVLTAEKQADGTQHAGPAASSPSPILNPPSSPLPPGVAAYQHNRSHRLGSHEALLATAPLKLAGVIGGIVQAEGPIHVEEAQRALAEAFATRVTPRTRAAFDRALAAALAGRLVAQRGEFLWPVGDKPAAVRFRDGDCPVTRPELIAPEEFAAAIKLVLAREFGIGQEALVTSTAKLMGFRRSGANLRTAVEAALAPLMQSGEVKADNAGFLVLREQG